MQEEPLLLMFRVPTSEKGPGPNKKAHRAKSGPNWIYWRPNRRPNFCVAILRPNDDFYIRKNKISGAKF